MAGVYEKWFQSPGLGPNWMHGPVGNAYWGSIGKVLDTQLERAKIALRCHYPAEASAMGMEDALEEIAYDRMLPRGASFPGESDESLDTWAARLKDAWNRWKLAGHAKGLLLELKVQGFPMGEDGASIFNHIGRRYYLDEEDELVVTNPCAPCINRMDLTGVVPDPPLTGFTLSARDQFYSVFCIVFLQNVPTLSNYAGNTAKAILNQTAARWRQGGARYAGAAVVPVDAGSWCLGWPPDIVLGQDGLDNLGESGARFIDPE